MRVLLINKFHYLRGGAERAYFDTARILAENGHTVAFFSMNHPDNLETPWSRFFVSENNYRNSSLGFFQRFRMIFRLWWNREAAEKLEALIQEFQPDVAHLHNVYHQLSPSIIWTLKKHGIRTVMTLHDYKLISPNYNLLVRGKIWDETNGFRAIFDRAVQNSYLKSSVCALEQWLHAFLGSYRQIDVFLSPSQFLKEKFQKAGFRQPIASIVQPLLPFPKPPTTFSGTYLLYIGRLSGEKGIGVLLEAMRILGGKEKLKIMGTGPEEAKWRKEAGSLPWVQFIGHKTGEEWEMVLRGAKAVILPSLWYENMPYVVLEALSRGKPVIASRLGGVPERILEGKNGFLFEAGNAVDLSQKIHDLSKVDMEQFAETAYKSVFDAQPEAYYENLLRHYLPPSSK